MLCRTVQEEHMEMPIIEQPNVCLMTDICVMTKERFALLSGLGEDVVRGMVSRGQLPTLKVGRHRMINLERLRYRCREVGG